MKRKRERNNEFREKLYSLSLEEFDYYLETKPLRSNPGYYVILKICKSLGATPQILKKLIKRKGVEGARNFKY